MKKRYLFFLTIIFSLFLVNYALADAFVFEPYTTSDTVTEYYLDLNGKTIKQKDTNIVTGSVYKKNAPAIEGYAPVNARINDGELLYSGTKAEISAGISIEMNTFSDDGDYVVFLYGEDKYSTGYPDDYNFKQDVEILIYDYSTGKKIDTIDYDDCMVGENFVYKPKINMTINETSYSFVKSVPSLNDDDKIEIFVCEDYRKNIIELYYKQGKSTDRYITVHYLDVDTDKEFDTDVVSNVKVDTTYVYDVKQKGGYNFISSSPKSSGFSNSISIKVSDDNDDNNIYCYFKKYSSDTNNSKYDGLNQYYVSPTDTFYNSSMTYNQITRSSGIPVNTTPYYNIVLGYSNNKFKPDLSITRAEAAQMFYNIAKDKSNGNFSVILKDVNSNDWYYKPIYYLASKGLMNGYQDGTFKPNNYITRAEFIKLATQVAGFEDSGINVSFSDVNSYDWFYNYVKAGISKNFINGYSDNTFRPKNYISRAEATKIVDQIVGRTLEYEYTYKDVYYSDVPTTHWAYPYVKMANGVSR